jgi:methylated-DNA-[protein]-cysteine S-methyltransferase
MLDELGQFPPATLQRLRERLHREADAAHLLDVAYRTIDSPVGTLLLAATPQGLVRVAFDRDDQDETLRQLSERISPRVLNAPHRLDTAAREIDEYFSGARRSFDLPVDLQLAVGFRRSVLAHLPEIAYGDTASYADIAALAGSPKAVRATGTACAQNPLPIVLPCHRVIRADGSLGGYVGGPETKALLLELEDLHS